jgi:hypothetical protein
MVGGEHSTGPKIELLNGVEGILGQSTLQPPFYLQKLVEQYQNPGRKRCCYMLSPEISLVIRVGFGLDIVTIGNRERHSRSLVGIETLQQWRKQRPSPSINHSNNFSYIKLDHYTTTIQSFCTSP